MEVRDEEIALIGFLDNYRSDDSDTVIAVIQSNERVIHSIDIEYLVIIVFRRLWLS